MASARAPMHAGAATRALGRTDYEATWHAMQGFTAARNPATRDEIWLTEHPPVYTLGLAGRREHLLRDNGIPALKVDRGGQITGDCRHGRVLRNGATASSGMPPRCSRSAGPRNRSSMRSRR